MTGWDAQRARLDRALLGWGPEALSPSLPACRLLSASCSPSHGSLPRKPTAAHYTDNYTRISAETKRAQHVNACMQCSPCQALFSGGVLYMCTPNTACPGSLGGPGNGSPSRHRGAPTSPCPFLPECVDYQVGYCVIKLVRVQVGKRGGIPASFLLVSPAPSCFACLLLLLLIVRVHPGMRIPALLPIARRPACPPASSCLAD